MNKIDQLTLPLFRTKIQCQWSLYLGRDYIDWSDPYKTILRVLFIDCLLNAEIMNCVLEHKIAMHKTS